MGGGGGCRGEGYRQANRSSLSHSQRLGGGGEGGQRGGTGRQSVVV